MLQGIVGTFAGGVIGALVGLRIGFGPVWVGMIVSAFVGGLVGWIIVDAQKFWAGMVSVWQDLRTSAPRLNPKAVRTPLERKESLWMDAAVAVLIGTFFFLVVVIGELTVYFSDPSEVLFKGSPFEHWALWQKLLVPYMFGTTPSLSYLALISCNTWLFGFPPRSYATDDELKEFIETSKLIILLGNAITLPFTLIWLIFTSLIPWLWKYVVALYRVTVSSYRISAMLGGAIGALFGHLFENPLAGGFIGALVWTGLSYFHHATEPVGS